MRGLFLYSLKIPILVFLTITQLHHTLARTHTIRHDAEKTKGLITLLAELMLLVTLDEHRIVGVKAMLLSFE